MQMYWFVCEVIWKILNNTTTTINNKYADTIYANK